jgi:hypothetical protein
MGNSPEGIRKESCHGEGKSGPLDYYNDCIVALDVLFEAAEKGSSGAAECLRAEADRLLRRAAEWRDMVALKY